MLVNDALSATNVPKILYNQLLRGMLLATSENGEILTGARRGRRISIHHNGGGELEGMTIEMVS